MTKMQQLGIFEGRKFYMNRLGYREAKALEDCKSLEDALGVITVTVTKVNRLSFKTDYDNERRDTIHLGWFDKVNREGLIDYLVERATNESYYTGHFRKAMEFLTEEEVNYVLEQVDIKAKRKANLAYSREYRRVKEITTRRLGVNQ